MNLLVTAPAETFEVALVIASSFRDRFDVMHLLDRNESSVLQALLTERVLVNVACPDLPPLTAVTFVPVVSAGEGVVVFLHQLLMLRAILFAVLCKFLAALVSAGALWFPWHARRLLCCITKAPEDHVSFRACTSRFPVCSSFIFADSTIS